MYRLLIRPLLFLLNPERAHHLVFSVLGAIGMIPGGKGLLGLLYCTGHPNTKPVSCMGLKFKNPIGLAAGFDKDAQLVEVLGKFGFGFIEVGTVTPKAQPGNPKPRMFRLKSDQALINRMGFNNQGLESIKIRLSKINREGLIIGGNIGKNKNTPNDQALTDYILGIEALHSLVDYFVVNVSSPNTPGLRALQEREPLTALLTGIMHRNAQLGSKPVLLKIAPDMGEGQLEDVVDIVRQTGLQGIIATNTTIERNGLSSPQTLQSEVGGLSGRPLTEKSTEVIRILRRLAGPEMVIIGVGGIFNADDAHQKIEAGANLVQVYTGFIYEGPKIVKKILKNFN